MRGFFLCALLTLTVTVSAQTTTTPVEGIKENLVDRHALVNATVVVAPGRVIENGIVLIDDGIIQAVGKDLEIPSDSRQWDLSGKTVYPGFIDIYMAHPSGSETGDTPPAPPIGPVSWNSNVLSHHKLKRDFVLSDEQMEGYRKLGFTTAQFVSHDGVFRGESVVTQLASGRDHQPALLPATQQVIALEFGKNDGNIYPGSLMGAIALIRQTLYDTQWYERAQSAYLSGNLKERPENNLSLEALVQSVNAGQRTLLVTNNELDFERLFAIGAEFNLDSVIAGNGYEYRTLETLQESGKTVIVPLNFPEPPQVENPELALDVSLATLQHWELAPSNAAFLADGGVPFAFTSHALEKPAKEFWPNLRKAVERGLAVSEALAALTTTAAEALGLDDRLGSIEKGKIANLVVADSDLFTEKDAEIELLFVDGAVYPTDNYDRQEPRGTWSLIWSDEPGPASITVTGSLKKLKATDSNEKTVSVSFKDDQLVFLTDGGLSASAYIRGDRLIGSGRSEDGRVFILSGTRTAPKDEENKEEETTAEPVPLVWDQYPAGAFGVPQNTREPQNVVIRDATIWTSGPQGKLENADLYIRRGKVAAVGNDLTVPSGVATIDGTGKHLTPGLIDAHSHTAIDGQVNEPTHSVTVEVRIGDVTNPTDVNLYRQLAGGLTAANQLHGSANTMGGQSQVIKLRWGESAEAYKFKDAKPGVKFALGENVKQSNWGDAFVTRYPQTRMGVEQVLRDTFLQARHYEQQWADFRSRRTRVEPRTDLRLQAALEILNRERWIHIHSYRQDEILMFVRLAQEFDLKVAAFQHVLEGYKVADAIKEIDAGASTFSDWWAYKFEVYDAIPYNGTLMQKAGVLTTFNSDSNELARRLNTEAAKAVKYGGMDANEALKLVTLNAAIQLGVEEWVGSLESGKDADFVIWNTNPLSTYAIAEQTWIDGIKYFDLASDQTLRQQANTERNRLLTKATKARLKTKADPKQKTQEAALRTLYQNHIHAYSCAHGGGHQ